MDKLSLLDLSAAKQNIKASGSVALSDTQGMIELFTGMQSASGQSVTRKTAMRASAVLACIRVLTEDIATLPLLLKKKTDNGSVDAVEHPAYNLLKTAPNPLLTSIDLREHMIMDACLTGHFACWTIRVNGEIAEIWPLRAQNLFPLGFQRVFGRPQLTFSYGGGDFAEVSKPTFTNLELWRGQLLSESNVGDGQALILLAREAIGLALAAEEQGARLFSNGMQTNMVIEAPADVEIDEDAKEQLRNSLSAAYAGSKNAFKTLLLENGLKASKLGLTAQESQYMDARNFQLAEIARIFRIPGIKLGLNDKTSTYASAEQFFQAYYKDTLRPWTARLEQSAQRDILQLKSDVNHFVVHDYNDILRPDQNARFTIYKMAVESGIMTRNECRALENLDTKPGLDEFLVPLNMDTPEERKAKQAENPTNPPDKTGQIPPQNGQNKARALAENIANDIVRGETRVFLAEKRRKQATGAENSSERFINFFAWQSQNIANLTGCTLDDAVEYCTLRCKLEDPVSDLAQTWAKEYIVNLCLGAAK